jgi:thymidylate kinase
LAIVEKYAQHEAEILREDFFASLLAACRIDEVEHQLARAGLDNLTVLNDRHLVVCGRIEN